jgi:hypothetical protein
MKAGDTIYRKKGGPVTVLSKSATLVQVEDGDFRVRGYVGRSTAGGWRAYTAQGSYISNFRLRVDALKTILSL